MGFTTPCFMVVDSFKHAVGIDERLKRIRVCKVNTAIGALNDVLFPCLCAVSTNVVFFGNMDGLTSAGFIDCGNKEALFFALVALTDNNDYWMQWLVRGDVTDKANWSFNMTDEISPLGLQLGYRRATAAELVAHLG